ncbi:MAG: universal stress protein [Deltaproteobacteria bacterium]|jgi:nucleotide-binding universal stress UspA family protein|nr:universal stress protein [Deltaproteobacteria bacterium]MBT4527524.1 universal stress protein [Deltaproteobacteria bacterium]
MEKKILVPITPSDVSKDLIIRADIWGQRTGAELRFLHVRSIVNPLDINFTFSVIPIEQEQEELSEFLKRLDLKSKYSINIRSGVIYSQIIEEEQAYQPDLIMMAAHSHTTLARLFLGSNTDYVVHHSINPVFVYRRKDQQEKTSIIVPLDYSEINKEVIKFADKWANRTNARINFIHVSPAPNDVRFSGDYVWIKEAAPADDNRRTDDRIRNVSLEEKQRLESYIEKQNITAKYNTIIKFGKPYQEILNFQKEINAKWIMIATHSHTLLNRIFIGSNTDYLLHHSDATMYIYKHKM